MGLTIVEIVIHLEQEFGVDLPDTEAGRLTTPGKLVDFIVEKLGASAERADVSKRVEAIIIDQLGIDAAAYTEDADLIRDLGAD